MLDGDPERAIELCREALILNPYGKYNWNLGLACFVAHQYDEVIRLLEQMRNPPEAVLAVLAASYAMSGDQANAEALRARFLDLAKTSPLLSRLRRPSDWQEYFAARWPFRDPRDLDHLIGALRHAGLPL